MPSTSELCTDLVRPGGTVANVGVHGQPAMMCLEKLWIRNVTVRTALVDTYSTPTLLKLVARGQLDMSRFITHRFGMSDFTNGYDRLRQRCDHPRPEGRPDEHHGGVVLTPHHQAQLQPHRNPRRHRRRGFLAS